MPKRTDIKSILIIGAGPIVIGQACEFDYSGTQACKALKEEGYRIILVNSNPATIMTDPKMADATYIEPINWQTLKKIIKKEKPCAVLPTMGGQTALNCALDLNRFGVFKKYNVELIGASTDAIDMAEDRDLFRKAMSEIGLETPKAFIAHSLEQAWEGQRQIGFPCIIRPSFTMGGSGGGIAYNKEEFEKIVKHGLHLSPTSEILLEESVLGWKEYEMEVVRDKNDNCIIICSIENIDPMGVHTGDSITVAPAVTLTDKEYQILRDASIAVLRKIGVETGGSNVQFAINPENGRKIIIEMNPRVSRSSALASKATGFPIAKVAALLAVGFSLDELDNDITNGKTPASFEPTLDYVVTKIPRFTFEKFPTASNKLTTQMKSVGEVMAIGRTFAESLQKALRSLEIGTDGLTEILPQDLKFEDKENILRSKLSLPTDKRIWYVADALRFGFSITKIYELCKIDPWYLAVIADLVQEEEYLKKITLHKITKEKLYQLKQKGFSDSRIASLLKSSEKQVRDYRLSLGIKPVYKRVDTCAAEFATSTAYMYSTYETDDECYPTDNKKIIILGGGPNRIGQGIEFDYCCVHAAMACADIGFETIMVNCNPETVSTDYDTSDRLYFEPLTFENVLDIIDAEKPFGVVVQYGGQTPLKLARDLFEAGVPIIGTSPAAIDKAENREKFQQIVSELNLKQPPNRTASSVEEASEKASEIGYPLVVRPSYVLGGRAMEVVHNEQDLQSYMNNAVSVSFNSPVLLDKFLDDAIEVDVDAVCDGERVIIGGILEHIEQAGIHSGDSACCLPPFSLSYDIQKKISIYMEKLAFQLNVLGLMNAQFAIQGDDIYILEVNPRASRTVPFVSKATSFPLAKIAAKVMCGISLKEQKINGVPAPSFFNVKESVFPFIKFAGVDPLLGPEMKSTGEVMGIGSSFTEGFAKGQIASGITLPKSGYALISVHDRDKKHLKKIAKLIQTSGLSLVATGGTAKIINKMGVRCKSINKVKEGRPHVIDMIKNDEITLIINTTDSKKAVSDSFAIRRECLERNIVYTTTITGGYALALAINFCDEYSINSLQEIHSNLEEKI
jgi:carbamoyl-phosphate synthase large subunit